MNSMEKINCQFYPCKITETVFNMNKFNLKLKNLIIKIFKFRHSYLF